MTALPNEFRHVSRATIADVLATVPIWWDRRVRDAGIPDGRPCPCLSLPDAPVPLTGVPLEELFEASPNDLGEAYIRALDSATRLREGRHYTPQTLADTLWRELREAGFDDGPVADPASGAGALLIPAVRDLVSSSENPAATLAEVPRFVTGTDNDPIAVWLGNVLLAAELLPLWVGVPERDRVALPQLLRLGNGLAVR